MKNLFVSLLMSFVTALSASSFHISSPDGRISANIITDNVDSSLKWSVTFNGQTICEPSLIGIEIDGVDLSRDIVSREIYNELSIDSYKLHCSSSTIETEWREIVIEALSGSDSLRFFVEMRCYDGGIAYRLRVPGDGIRRVSGEHAEFRLPQYGTAWFGERNSTWKLMTYAGEFTHAPMKDLNKVSQQGPVQTMPLLCQVSDSLFVMIAEAALFNYSGMRLNALPTGEIVSDFTEQDGFDVNGEILTPWRVLIIEENLTDLVNSHLIYDLAPAPDERLFADCSWIRPGRSVWSWWSNIDGRFMDEKAEQEMVDVAEKLGFEYTTLDEGWEDVSDKWTFVRNIVEYGSAKGVGVILWRHSDRLINSDDDYRDMATFMDSVAAVGAKGLKIDFMNGEDKCRIDFTTRALQLAAERRLIINFHGCQKPTGEIRTYPNELTREAVRGLELNRITADYNRRMAENGCKVNVGTHHVVGGENQCIPASHNVVLPLTRGILGPSDYTPIGFSMPGNTTWAHQLASAYCISSSLMTMAENPFYLFRESGLCEVLPFIRAMPVIWDETIVLPATVIGEALVMARRCGEVWYVAGMTVDGGDAIVGLDFLDDGSEYSGEWIKDASAGGQCGVVAGNAVFRSDDKFGVEMNPAGGFVLKLSRMK